MATAPTVDGLDKTIAELNPLYQGSINNLNAQKGLVPQKYDAQRTALDAAKVQGFNQINNQATGRGLAFSGIPLNEQANYLSTTYLPGMQQADFQQNADVLALDQALAQLDLQRGTQAIGIREQQQSALNQYLLQQQSQEFQASQAALDRAAAMARSSGGGGGGGGSASSQQGYYTSASKSGGTNFYDPNGNPITAAQYFNARGGNSGDLLAFLNSSQGGQRIVAELQAPGANVNAIKQKYSYVFGGI